MTERLNTFYICKKCDAGFIFNGELADHQRETGHAGTFAIPLDERYARAGVGR